jgi:orotidine-5'-phosphate decarboxylase
MKKVFIACDTTDVTKVERIIKNTQTNELTIGYKFGLEFFNSKKGRPFISKLKNNYLIFLDCKLNDIPNTVSSSIYALKDLSNIKYLTVHASGGLEMMRAAKKAANKINKKIKILGVTVLTSLSDNSLKKIGYKNSIKSIVVRQAKLCRAAGLDGVVASGYEAKIIKKICKKMEIITPGIRFKGDNSQDQKRVMSPQMAFNNGATAIVIGRSITKNNIKKNIQNLIKSLK